MSKKRHLNKTNVLALANFLATRGPKYFDMARWRLDENIAGRACGTVACIGGSAVLLWPEVDDHEWRGVSFRADAKAVARKLGLLMKQARELFYPYFWTDGSDLRYEYVTLNNAVHTLRRLARTGKVEFRKNERRKPFSA